MADKVENATNEVKAVPFVKLQDLSAADVKKLSLFTVKLKRRVNNSGLSTTATLLLNDLNLQVNLVSSERLSSGTSRQLRYFLPDVFIALIIELGLPQQDDLKKDKNDWNVPVALRFVKGKYKNSENEYHSIEVIFKQYKYHVHFLTPHQLTILNALSASKKLIDRSGKPVKINWIERPDAIDEVELESGDFAF